MGKSYKPKYILELKAPDCVHSSMAWKGRVSEKRLEEWVYRYIDSLQAGGANEHISAALGVIPLPTFAAIRRNYLGTSYLATWKAPMFMAF
jgi:hypothetical protein